MTENGGKVAIKTESGIEKLTNVADIAEVSPNRLMIADAEGDQQMCDGTIFGAWGRWKTWHEKDSGAIVAFTSDDPMTMPNDEIRLGVDGYTKNQTGRLKRLKIPTNEC